MFEFEQEHNLSVCALSIGRIVKRIKIFFQGFDLFAFTIYHFENMAIRTTSYFLDNFVSGEYMSFDLFWHFSWALNQT